uniref:Uncharacterized protein n=1 Tax=Lepeophtheirus salmonis TaxID=72036 RepID=A0A0K2TF49_LEPSM
MEDFSESTFECEVQLDSLSNVPHIEKSSGFKPGEEGAISLWTRIEPRYLCRTFGTWRTFERGHRPESTSSYSPGSWSSAMARWCT